MAIALRRRPHPRAMRMLSALLQSTGTSPVHRHTLLLLCRLVCEHVECAAYSRYRHESGCRRWWVGVYGACGCAGAVGLDQSREGWRTERAHSCPR